MAIEKERGCGFRKVGGLYLVADDIIAVPCDRLPYPLKVCPVCGQGIKIGRAFTRINPFELFGNHDEEISIDSELSDRADLRVCKDKIRPCIMCDPPDEWAFIMLVGEKFYPTPEDFIREGQAQGVSKRIPFIPKELKIGKTIIYLAHNKALLEPNDSGAQKKNGQYKLVQDRTGIFSAFIPKRIEKLCWESELKGKKGQALRKKLEGQGITIVEVPDGETDHV